MTVCLQTPGEAVMTTKGLEREQKLKMRREAADAIGFDLNLPQPTEALSIFKGKSGKDSSFTLLNHQHYFFNLINSQLTITRFLLHFYLLR